jgi:hypothetical protein
MHSTKTIENFRKKELELNISGKASWHNDVISIILMKGSTEIVHIFSSEGSITILMKETLQ